MDDNKKKILKDTTFISTVYNEEGTVNRFLESLQSQTVLPAEIIIVDGGSRDRTFSLMERFFQKWAAEKTAGPRVYVDGVSHRADPAGIRVELLKKEGAGISLGRNTAIGKASGTFISVSDAGCILDPGWLEEINREMKEEPLAVNGGMNYSACKSFLQKLAALCIMPGVNEIRQENFMPSSRNICFRKSQWQSVGGYPQELDYGEDMKFDFNLKKAGYELRFRPGAAVYWEMRQDLSGIFRQFFRYAKGDALGRMYPLRHIIRFLSGSVFVAVVLAGILVSPWIFFTLVILAVAYCFRPYYRLLVKWAGNEACLPWGAAKLPALIFIPLLLVYIDTAKVFGYLYGRARKQPGQPFKNMPDGKDH